mgnify:CR=1 FL=1
MGREGNAVCLAVFCLYGLPVMTQGKRDEMALRDRNAEDGEMVFNQEERDG